eukprot:521280_1
MVSSTEAIVLGVYFGAVNVFAIIIYGYDKGVAWSERSGVQRVPEKVLHSIELIGGSLGAWIAQKAFNHKLRKRSFMSQFLVICILQLISLVLICVCFALTKGLDTLEWFLFVAAWVILFIIGIDTIRLRQNAH